jgi:hypothetical protein
MYLKPTDMTKSSAWLGALANAAGKGFLSHTASLLGGSLGTGGLLKAIGSLLGGSHTVTRMSASGKLVKKLIPMNQLKGKLGWKDSIGQQLSLWGDDLTRWTKKLHRRYMGSVDNLTGSHKNWKGRALRFGLIGPAALAAPVVYSGWAEDPKNSNKALAQPAHALKKLWDYGSLPGLVATGVQKGSELYGKSMQKATMDGAAVASKLINYELANQPRAAYLAGVYNPAYFASKTDAAVQNYLKQLNQMQFNQ